MRLPTLLSLTFLLLSCSPEEAELHLQVESMVTDVDRITVTVLDPHGALVVDQPFPESGALRLPGRIAVERSGHTDEMLRFLVWGFRGGARVAFGPGMLPGNRSPAVVAITLVEPLPSDQDGDLIPDSMDGCVTVSDPRQEDADADGVTDACEPPSASCPGNILANPGFDDDLSEWIGVNGAKEAASPGYGGIGRAARICWTGSNDYFTLEEAPPQLRNPQQGRTYRVSAWVRGAPGQQLSPVIREVGPNDAYVGSSDPKSASTGEWQLLSTEYTVKGTNSVGLVVEFTSWNPSSGECFDVDQACFVEVTE
ncbi:MAG: carbohydrate binding domain-containing protein [Myxococcaceae bacterium]